MPDAWQFTSDPWNFPSGSTGAAGGAGMGGSAGGMGMGYMPTSQQYGSAPKPVPNNYVPTEQPTQQYGASKPVPSGTQPASSWFGNTQLFQPVTGGTVNEAGGFAGTVNLAPQPTFDAASQVAQMFGANLYQQTPGMGPAGPLSAPLYGLDFGAGDLQDPSFIINALQRGDKPESVLARLQAGINPYLGQGTGSHFYYESNPLATNLAPGAISQLAGGKAPLPSGPMSQYSPATNLGPIGGARPTGQPANAPSQAAFQGAFAPWLQPNVASGPSNRPFYAPMALQGLGGQRPGTQYSVTQGPSGFTRWQGNYSVPFLGQSDWMSGGSNQAALLSTLAQLLSSYSR